MHESPTRVRFIRNLLSLLTLVPVAGFSHTGITAPGVTDLVAGALHPLTGLDHLLAMMAVGLWAARQGNGSTWFLPALFPVVMTIGAGLALTGTSLPLVEPLITASVIVLGVLALANIRLPLMPSGLLLSLFALAHGHAHGTEMPAGGDIAAYATGFIGSTVILQLTGLFLGLYARRRARCKVGKTVLSGPDSSKRSQFS
jgi:urease accessory protein